MTPTPSTIEDPVMVEEMVARMVTTDDKTLTLRNVSPSTLYFSDPPEREVGQMTTQQLIAQWTEGPNSFAEDPPNAVLSYVDAGVVLRDPVAGDGTLTYSIEVLDGTLPAGSAR